MYKKTYKIRKDEVDKNNHLTLVSLFYYLQDIMVRNANSYGASSSYHHELGLAWVLVDYDIDVMYLPSIHEEITCGTLPYSFKKYYGYRIYEATGDNGVIAKGKSRFVLMDFVSKTLAMPSKEILELFTDAVKEPTVLPLSKHRPLDGSIVNTTEVIVQNHDIDENHHMNNVKYVEYAIDSLKSLDFDPSTVSNVRITYKKECYLNDHLSLLVVKIENTLQVQFLKENEILCLVTFQ
jgi:medium-chain acyl-[acyl-carrier-protein] hydrolase